MSKGISLLFQEAGISTVGMSGICFKNVVGKEDIRDFILTHIVLHILREISGIHHMHLLERIKEETRERIAETVFQYQ